MVKRQWVGLESTPDVGMSTIFNNCIPRSVKRKGLFTVQIAAYSGLQLRWKKYGIPDSVRNKVYKARVSLHVTC